MASKTKSDKSNRKAWHESASQAVIESIRKGQLPTLGFLVLAAILLWRTPNEFLPKLWDHLLSWDSVPSILSYSANLILILLWRWHACTVRNIHEPEIKRLSNERTRLQSRVVEVHSSEET
jgi:hypothetical protein